MDASGKWSWPAADAADAVQLGETAGCVTFEGTTANVHETRVCSADAGSDITYTLPSAEIASGKFMICTASACSAQLGAGAFTNTTSFAGPSGGNSYMVGYGIFQAGAKPITFMSDARGFVFADYIVADYAHAAATDPTIFVHSHNSSTTQWTGITHNATDGVISTGTGNLNLAPASGAIYGVQAKTLTESAATSFVQIAVAASTSVGGSIIYTIRADDATDFQARSGVLPFAAVNKAGTETCTVGTVGAATDVVAVSAGTLANTFTCSTTPTNAVDIQANAVSSLTQTTLAITYRVELSGNVSNTVTPQ